MYCCSSCSSITSSPWSASHLLVCFLSLNSVIATGPCSCDPQAWRRVERRLAEGSSGHLLPHYPRLRLGFESSTPSVLYLPAPAISCPPPPRSLCLSTVSVCTPHLSKPCAAVRQFMSEQAPVMGGDGWAGLSSQDWGRGGCRDPWPCSLSLSPPTCLPSPQLPPKDTFKRCVGRLPWWPSD